MRPNSFYFKDTGLLLPAGRQAGIQLSYATINNPFKTGAKIEIIRKLKNNTLEFVLMRDER